MTKRQTFAQRLATAISDEPFALSAAEALRVYMDDSNDDGGYDGRHFETYGAGDTTPSRIAPADLVAVTCLSMEITPRSRSGFTPRHALAIERERDRITALLKGIPADRPLHTLSPAQYDKWIGPGSPAIQLWDLLRKELGTPPVATFKLLARKRPHLLPIRDSATKSALGSGGAWWESWWNTLSSDPLIVERLTHLRDEAETPDLSLLRVADVVIWMRRDERGRAT